MVKIVAYCFLIGCIFVNDAHAGPVKVDYYKGVNGEPSIMKSEAYVQAEPGVVWNAIANINGWNEFMPKTPAAFYVSEDVIPAIQNAGTYNANRLLRIAKKYKVPVPRDEGKVWSGLVFQVINTPFPVANRWFVLRYVNDETHSAKDIYELCWDMVLSNVNTVDGCFKILPDDNPQKSRIYYQERVDLGGKVPEWVVKIGVRHTTPKLFSNLEKYVNRH